MLKIKNKGFLLGWSYLWRYRKRLFKILFISLGGAVLGSVVPMVFGKLVQIAPQADTPLWLFAFLVLVWAILDQTYNWTTRYTDKNGAYVAWDASADLFVESMWHLIKLPMSFLGDQRLGKIVQRLDRSAEYLERDIRDVVFSVLPHFVTAVLGLVFVLSLNWRLSILLFVVVICYILAMLSKTKLILEKTRKTRKMWEECWGYLWDVINNVRVVKSNTTEKFEMQRIREKYNLPFKEEKEIEGLRTQLKNREHLVFGLGAVAALSTGVYLLRINIIDAGALVAFLYYINLVYKPFSQLSHNWRLVQESTIALERTAKFLELQEEDYQSGESYEMKGRIEFQNITFAYKTADSASRKEMSSVTQEDSDKKEDTDEDDEEKETVFENLNFTVEVGETIALVGESGVGKTTLIDLISRYFNPINGSILIDGKDIKNWNLKSLRSQIAVVPQDVSLFNDTIRLNIGYGNLERLDRIDAIEEAAGAAYAHDFITSSKFARNYDTVVGERGVKVSTGQRQRIAIARAFLRSSHVKILILDEITSALDSESEKHIQESLAELKRGKTTFIIAHRLSTIKNADKIVVLDKGGIAQIGRHEELLAQEGPYRKFVELQSLGAAS